jgi:hypothetical protein
MVSKIIYSSFQGYITYGLQWTFTYHVLGRFNLTLY